MDPRKKVEKVSDTARPILAIKYVTSQPSFWKEKVCGTRSVPLSNIEGAKHFISEDDIEAAKNNPKIDHIKTVSVRERWINKLLHKYVKEKQHQQVLILGSGFDIRPLKKNSQNQEGKKHASLYSHLKFWEIDKAEILDEKERIFKEKGLDKNAEYIKADYTKSNLLEQLVAKDFNLNSPTLVILEGNLMYLEENQVREVFNKLQESLKEFVIAFDYFPQKIINFISSSSAEGTNEKLWKTGIDDLEKFAREFGLVVEKNENIATLSQDYQVDINPSAGAKAYSVCALRK